jgi:hypothetical protein
MRSMVAGLIAALTLALVSARPECRWYSSKRFGYSVCYPATWFLLDPSIDPAGIVNFPPSRRVRAVVIPAGGALVVVTGAPENIEGVRDWIARDRNNLEPAPERTYGVCCYGGGPVQVTETTLHSAIPPISVTVTDYLSLGGKLFSASLVYWAGDPHARRYLDVLHAVAGHLKVGGPDPHW